MKADEEGGLPVRVKGPGPVNGLGMSLHQALEQIRLWTGVKPPLAVMRRALEEAKAEHAEES